MVPTDKTNTFLVVLLKYYEFLDVFVSKKVSNEIFNKANEGDL